MHDQVAHNQRRSLVLIATFTVITAVIVAAVLLLLGLGYVGAIVAVAIAGGCAFAAYRTSDAVALAMARAVPADEATYARLHNVVDGLCVAAGLAKPALHVIDDVAPNAFVAGRNDKHAVIAVTTGLLGLLDRVELEAVLAHELSHVKSRDIQVSTVAITSVGLVTLLADALVRMKWWNGGRTGRDDREQGRAPLLGSLGVGILVLSPLLARLLHLAVNDRRAPRADMAAVGMTRYPPAMISALEKLREDSTVVAGGARSTAHLWIMAPIALVDGEGELAKWNRMFDRHPPVEERIEALREL